MTWSRVAGFSVNCVLVSWQVWQQHKLVNYPSESALRRRRDGIWVFTKDAARIGRLRPVDCEVREL